MKNQNDTWTPTPSTQCRRLLARSTCAASVLLGLAATSLAQPVEEPPQPGAPAPAVAQPEPTAPPPTPAPIENAGPNTPGFATMVRANGESFIEVTGAYARYEGDQPDFNFRTELYGQYIAPSGTGGYASIPFAIVGENDESISGLAHFEFGAIHNIVQDANTQWVLRGGMLINPSDDAETLAANLLTSYNRLTDLVSIYPESTWLRLSASHLHRSGKLFLRSDGGLDLNIDAPEGSDFDSLMRLNFAAGLDMGSTVVAAEVVSTGTTGDVGDGDRFLTNLALSLRGGRGSGYDTFISMVLPLDDGFMEMGLLAGMRFPLGG